MKIAFSLAAILSLVAMAQSPIKPTPAPTTPVTNEPAYCDLNTFKSLEIKSEKNQLERLHAYQLGQVVVAGLAVGNSDASDVIALSKRHGSPLAVDKYCTWYLNDGNNEAEHDFTWEDMTKPTSMSTVNEYTTRLSKYFSTAPVNFVKCADDYQYIAMGCDGMKHRGPTVFGMLLAYSGCSPQHAVDIVNSVWGTNGIPTEVRVAIAQKAYDLGVTEKAQSAHLQQSFTTVTK